MQLHINPHDQAPVYRQIQQQIARAIANREIHPGDLLEPQQDLASHLAISPAAVRKAYQGLQTDGLCTRSSAGHYEVTTPELGDTSGTNLALSLLKRELLNQELQTASDVQRRLLPPTTLTGESWTLSGRSYPAGALAGDFYEVIVHDEGPIDLIVSDVAGKGLAAGLIMATTRSLVALAALQDSAGSALEDLNARLLPLLNSREFVALSWARFDPQNGSLQVANAGLPDPYLLRHTGLIETLDIEGDRLPLGIREEVHYSSREYALEETDRLLIVTDGILEAADAEGNLVGYDGFKQLLDASIGWTWNSTSAQPGLWLDRLLDRVSHRTGSILEDDWTAVLLEYQES